jgi:group I intron endonuclease
MGIIYKVTNIVDGKCYIGKTIQTFRKRQYKHMYYATEDLDNTYFHNAIIKYGEENFKWEVIFECDDPLILNVMETFKIMICHSHKSEGGYNLTWGGEGSYGFKHSEETKKKMREIHKGKVLTPDHKRKIGKGNKGKTCTDETKLKMSLSQRGKNNPMYGKKLSDATKKRIGQSQKGKPKPKNRKYSTDVFERCIIKYKAGMEFDEISKDLGVPISTMQYWFKKCNLIRRKNKRNGG